MEFNLKKVIKALLFSAAEPLSIKDIQKGFNRESEEQPSTLTAVQIRSAVESIAQELIESEEVYRLLAGPSGFSLVIAPEYAPWVRSFRGEAKPVRLRQAAMETLALVAYRQPVTRAEMETVRGVAVDSAINRLIDYGLIRVIGRANLPGRPIQYGTTDQFLEFCGIASLEELPVTDVLSEAQIQKELGAESLSEVDVGLPEAVR